MMNSTYFSDTTMISDQKISDSAAEDVRRRSSGDAVAGAKVSLHRVQRAGADVAEDDPEREQRQGGVGGLRRMRAAAGHEGKLS